MAPMAPRGRYERRVWQADPSLHAPARHRRACSYLVFLPERLGDIELRLSGEVSGLVSTAEAAIADLNGAAAATLAPLARLLLRTESIASSKVEGLQIDSRALARAEAKQDAGRRIGAEAAEILANVDAMQLAIERVASASSMRAAALLDIHRALIGPTLHAHIAGRLRTTQNWIGGNDYNPCGADFVPPPPEQVVALLDDLCAFCDDDTLPPIVQAALAHAQFETIHPFDDGNGRTGRALVQVVLRRRGLAPNFVPPISVLLAHRREAYIRGLTDYRKGRVDEWLVTFALAAARAARLASEYVRDVRALQDEWRERLRQFSNPRADAAVWAIIDALPAHPIITIPVAVAATGRTRPAVANGVEQLEAAGVLVTASESVRYRAWEAAGLLDLIASVETGERLRS